MEIVSRCRLPVGSIVWQRAPASWVQTVVCKATFDLLPGEAALAERQDPVLDDDRFHDGDPGRSLLAPSDLAPVKARADVVLVGRAFAPGGRPVRSLVARLIAGEVDKAVEVFGDRAWDAAGALREGPPFTAMSLAYEHAAGGPDTWNPAGMRLDAPPDPTGCVPLPNLQPPDQKLTRRGDFLAPIGLGPIAPTWPLRAHLIRHLRATFSPAHLRDQPLPPDFDEGYFNAAPLDQQADDIPPEARLVLENLHPDHPRLATRLPGLYPQVWLDLPGAPAQRVPMRGDLLWIDTDRAVAVVTWRGQIPLRRPDDPGRVVVGLEARTPLRRSGDGGWVMVGPDARDAEASGTARADPLAGLDVGDTLPPGVGGLRSALPFPARASVAEEVFRASVPPSPLPPPVVPAPPALVISAGVLAASNAAAGAGAKGEAQAADRPAGKAGREGAREAIELLWYDPAAVPRIRRNLAWKKIIAELKPRPSDDDFDGGLPPDQMKAAKDKRDVLGVLARGEVMDMEGIQRAMEMAVLEDGSFVPPYVLTAGVLEFVFDEMETLKATLVAVAPFVPLDRKLKETVDYVNEVMRTPGIERARGVVVGLCERVRAAFGEKGRGVAAGYLEETVEGMMVEGRCWRKRVMMGEMVVEAMFGLEGGAEGVSAWLSEEGERGMPALRRFGVRLVGEVARGVASVELVVMALAKRIEARRP